MSGLIEDNLTLAFAFIVNLLWYVISVGVHEKNLAPHRYVVGQRRNILIGK